MWKYKISKSPSCILFLSLCFLLLFFFGRHHSHHSGLVFCSLPVLQPPREPRRPGPPHWSLLTSCSGHWAQQLAHRLRQPVPSRGLAAFRQDAIAAGTRNQTQGLDCCSVILISGNHVLPNPLCPPGGLPPSPQPTLPHALPHRPGPVRVPHLPGPAEPHQAEWAHTLVQKPGTVLLQRALGAVWLQVCCCTAAIKEWKCVETKSNSVFKKNQTCFPKNKLGKKAALQSQEQQHQQLPKPFQCENIELE